eukprot:g39.t1
MSSVQFNAPLLDGSFATKTEGGDGAEERIAEALDESERGVGTRGENKESDSLIYKTPMKRVPILKRIFSNGTSTHKKNGRASDASGGRGRRRPRGLAYSWGWNNNGQLGHNDVIPRIKPGLIKRLGNFGGKKLSVRQIVCGSRCCMALTDKGSLFSWGRGDDGQLGHGDKNPQRQPRLVEAFAHKSITSVALRGSHAIALDSKGVVYSWGRGDDGQLGTGTRSELTPCKIRRLDHVKITEVACGRMMTIAIANAGPSYALYSWGCNDDGSTGHGMGIVNEYPKEIKTLTGISIRSISCGSRHTLVATEKGEMYSWGWGIYGQLGHGDTTNKYVPDMVQSMTRQDRSVIQVAAGYRHSFAICEKLTSSPRRSTSREKTVALLNRSPSLDPQPFRECKLKYLEVWAWGWNQYGQLGNGSTASSSVPIPIRFGTAAGGVAVVGICGGGRHSMAVVQREDETHMMYAWGRGDDGQLGISEIGNKLKPHKLKTSRLGNEIRGISCGWAHSVAVMRSDVRFHRQPTILQTTQSIFEIFMSPRGWFSKGDMDGFAAQLLGGITQYMLLLNVLPNSCGIDEEMVLKDIMPPVALSYLLGNTMFGLQGLWLMQKERRFDVTAQINGVSIVMFYAFALTVMQPAYQDAYSDAIGSGKSQEDAEQDAKQKAWEAGIFANLMTGLLEACSVLAISALRKMIPREAMLSAVAGVSLTFLTMDFMFQIFNSPSFALFPALFMIICAGSNINLPYGIPIGFASLLIGTALAWFTRAIQTYDEFSPDHSEGGYSFEFPYPHISELVGGFSHGWSYMTVIVPMYMVNFVSSLSNAEAAHSVGDNFPIQQTLLMDACLSIFCALCGSPFPTQIFIGQPAFKAMGVRCGYTFMTAVTLFLIGVTGLMKAIIHVVPVAAGVGFLMWIGLLVTQGAFIKQGTSQTDHTVAVIVGLIPALASWALGHIESTYAVMSAVISDGYFGNETVDLTGVFHTLTEQGTYVYGMAALSQGYLLVSICLSSMVVFIIDRKFAKAAFWMLIASFLSIFGFIHSYDLKHNYVETLFGLPGSNVDKYGSTYSLIYFAGACFCLVLHIRERDRTSLTHWREKADDCWSSVVSRARRCARCRCDKSDEDEDGEIPDTFSDASIFSSDPLDGA